MHIRNRIRSPPPPPPPRRAGTSLPGRSPCSGVAVVTVWCGGGDDHTPQEVFIADSDVHDMNALRLVPPPRSSTSLLRLAPPPRARRDSRRRHDAQYTNHARTHTRQPHVGKYALYRTPCNLYICVRARARRGRGVCGGVPPGLAKFRTRR